MGKNYLKVFILSVGFVCAGLSAVTAQVFNPVTWEYKSVSLGDNEFELQFSAEIEAHWHLYSQFVGEPVRPTSFLFKESANYELIGKVEEGEGITVHDKVFDMELKYFENEALFTQKVKITGASAKIIGDFEFMACDDKTCIPPEIIEFQFDLKEETTEVNTSGELRLSLSSNATISQNQGVLTPVTWTTKVIDHGDNVYELQAIAEIEANWHVYSMVLPEKEGPKPQATEFLILTPKDLKPVEGPVEIGEVIEENDPNFDMVLAYYANSLILSQKVKVENSNQKITAEVYFMACDDGTCIPPEAIELEYDLTKAVAPSGDDVPASSFKKGEEKSMLTVIVLSFLGGLTALLTPCVFPMIPMTVSFFTKQSKTKAEGIKNALIYGFSIIGIYVLLGVGVSSVFGADALNALATNVYFNLFFFVLLIVFAISFLGAFEITLPSSWVNKADSNADKGGLIGIFFMAFVLALVSFSCTGPIIGTLLVEAAVNGGYMGPIIGMLSFSTALALPFALFAMFPGWMNSLPKSGGWLNTVKVVLGFLELALAFKFLSNADLVLQAHWLPRELFLAIWITVFGALAIYLFGWIKLPHDSPLDGISVGRLLMALVVTMFTIYLIPGMWGAPLKVISGFPPPAFYSESPNGVGYKSTTFSSATGDQVALPKGAEPDHCPYNINCFHDYELGLSYAKESGLPVMLDFTGWACVNCRKMEEQVWSDPHVLEMLKGDYVLISLYVDEKTKLPESEQYVSPTTGKKIKTVGNKWSDMQIREYGTNAQPYYVVLDHNEKQLHEHAAYDPDIPKFLDWLERGKNIFKESK
ncbi:MAG: thiol:disulfide interchange protein [Salibacteraceae bacterium]|jgi:thiol:disulfide interchange protein